MSPETNDRSAQEIQDAMDEEAGRMQERVDELGEHSADAEKKAEVTREHADPDADEPLGEVAGDWSDNARTDEDPTGAIDDPPDDDE